MSDAILNTSPLSFRIRLRNSSENTFRRNPAAPVPTYEDRMPSFLVDSSSIAAFDKEFTDKGIITMLRDEDAWTCLSDAGRRKIYADLDGVTGRVSDHTIHPLRHPIYGPNLRSFISNVERHTANGANRAWEREARQASAMRARQTMSAPARTQGPDGEDYFAKEPNNKGKGPELGGVNAEGANGETQFVDEDAQDGGQIADGRAASADI